MIQLQGRRGTLVNGNIYPLKAEYELNISKNRKLGGFPRILSVNS